MPSSELNGAGVAKTPIDVFVDLEIMSYLEADLALRRISDCGPIRIVQMVGDFSKNPKFASLDEHYPIQYCQIMHVQKGCGSSDVALVVEAMNAHYERGAMRIALVSTDRGYRYALSHLRSRGVDVLVASRPEVKKTYSPLAHTFISLDMAGIQERGAESKIEQLVEKLSDGEWVDLAVIGRAIRAEIDPSLVRKIGRLATYFLHCQNILVEKHASGYRCKSRPKRKR